MKRALNILFVTNSNSYLRVEGENIVVCDKERQEERRVPLGILEAIYVYSYQGASPGLIGKCVREKKEICFFEPNGRFLYRAVGRENGSVLVRMEQRRIADDPVRCCRIARNIISAKLYNSRKLLLRACRNHELIIDAEKIRWVGDQLKRMAGECLDTDDLEALRGLEASAAQQYFSCFDELILNKSFSFEKRTRRPPMNAFNALLSFLYALVRGSCYSAIMGTGLDPFVGVMHALRSGREALALDLMEEFRACMADKLALRLVNTKMLNVECFDVAESGAVSLNQKGRKTVFSEWIRFRGETIVHPYLKEKVGWGYLPYLQGILFNRYIRGDLDEYPAFFWRD